jgi:hypothetical protein
MASYAAIAATSRAIIGPPEAGAPGDPEFGTAAFSICTPTDLQAPPSGRLTVPLRLYHVAVDARL